MADSDIFVPRESTLNDRDMAATLLRLLVGGEMIMLFGLLISAVCGWIRGQFASKRKETRQGVGEEQHEEGKPGSGNNLLWATAIILGAVCFFLAWWHSGTGGGTGSWSVDPAEEYKPCPEDYVLDNAFVGMLEHFQTDLAGPGEFDPDLKRASNTYVIHIHQVFILSKAAQAPQAKLATEMPAYAAAAKASGSAGRGIGGFDEVEKRIAECKQRSSSCESALLKFSQLADVLRSAIHSFRSAVLDEQAMRREGSSISWSLLGSQTDESLMHALATLEETENKMDVLAEMCEPARDFCRSAAVKIAADRWYKMVGHAV